MTLRELRIARGLNQPALAAKLGITKGAVSAFESGRWRPSIELLCNLAALYELHPVALAYAWCETALAGRAMPTERRQGDRRKDSPNHAEPAATILPGH